MRSRWLNLLVSLEISLLQLKVVPHDYEEPVNGQLPSASQMNERKQPLKPSKHVRVHDDDILELDKPVYMAKWRSKLVAVILQSENKERTYTVRAANSKSNKCWTVPELFHQAKAERK
jgi:hypothetical protein